MIPMVLSKKIACLLIILMAIPTAFSQLDSLEIQSTHLYFHQIKNNNKSLLIFLHGGVSEYKNLAKPVSRDTIELLDGNDQFISATLESGYDVVLPVAFNQWNWLEKEGEEFVLALVDRLKVNYSKIMISGFSDGGTGSYRIFYKSPDLFSGLMVFNGYPQLGFENRNVDYLKVQSKPTLFISTEKDKVIPCEFLMVEHLKQKMVNPLSFLMIEKGEHEFSSYSLKFFNKCFALASLNGPEERVPSNDALTINCSTLGFSLDDQLLKSYSFNKKVAKKFGMNETFIELIIKNGNELQSFLEAHKVITTVSIEKTWEELLSLKTFTFDVRVGSEIKKWEIPNWYILDPWATEN